MIVRRVKRIYLINCMTPSSIIFSQLNITSPMSNRSTRPSNKTFHRQPSSDCCFKSMFLSQSKFFTISPLIVSLHILFVLLGRDRIKKNSSGGTTTPMEMGWVAKNRTTHMVRPLAECPWIRHVLSRLHGTRRLLDFSSWCEAAKRIRRKRWL